MEKDFKFSALMDIYRGLLTEKQAQTLDYYYNEDYSLAEISELMDITRQGARDFIKRGEAALLSADRALGLSRRFKALDTIRERAGELQTLESDVVRKAAGEIISAADYVQNGEK